MWKKLSWQATSKSRYQRNWEKTRYQAWRPPHSKNRKRSNNPPAPQTQRSTRNTRNHSRPLPRRAETHKRSETSRRVP